MKRVLLIAFQYPPMTGTSGTQRALRFSQYLPQFGWEPIVLTASPCAYEKTSDDQMGDIPKDVHVSRAFALDAARHLAIRGKYPSLIALPDRWSSWSFSALLHGLSLIRRFKPAAIWSTFPIPTAHLIGLWLHRYHRLPWIADFRDVMTEDGYPSDRLIARCWQKLEERIITRCSVAVFTAKGAATMYANRYSHIDGDRFVVIENGYDEEAFASVVTKSTAAPGHDHGLSQPLVVLHSGAIYPAERDPTEFFIALKELSEESPADLKSVRFVLRATGHDTYIRSLIEQMGVQDLVELRPPISYRSAIEEMCNATALLVMQSDLCNRQIPAKLYECLRTGRPILGLASGDTAAALSRAGIDTVAPLESKLEIKQLLVRFVRSLREGTAIGAREHETTMHSRSHRTKELAGLLQRIER